MGQKIFHLWKTGKKPKTKIQPQTPNLAPRDIPHGQGETGFNPFHISFPVPAHRSSQGWAQEGSRHSSLPSSCGFLSLGFPPRGFGAAVCATMAPWGWEEKVPVTKAFLAWLPGGWHQPPCWSLATAATQEGFVPWSRTMGLHSKYPSGAQKAPGLALAPLARSWAIKLWLLLLSSCWERDVCGLHRMVDVHGVWCQGLQVHRVLC